MYTLYRRHEQPGPDGTGGCRFRHKGIRYIKCACPIWMDGYNEHGKRQRRSLKTRSWSQAQARLTDIEAGHPLPVVDSSPGVDPAVADFFDDCRARKLEPSTITSYENPLGHVATFFAVEKLSRINLE